jgi:hypothetical protein|uniref:Uncharacterized protein n=1 Tax=Picea glauca TaxID=3330 RepID=A0A101LU79_PICGL|nr:hypothetical protein ABT39_MTgene2551 [Picea glauca]QHR88042.1 hypothetical protein Q903MT_gene2054 [Picea sitchensis]
MTELESKLFVEVHNFVRSWLSLSCWVQGTLFWLAVIQCSSLRRILSGFSPFLGALFRVCLCFSVLPVKIAKEAYSSGHSKGY